MATARRTRNSANDGLPKSTAAKSPARAAIASSPRKASGARGAAKSRVAGTSVTATSTEPSTPDPSTPAAIEGQRPTESSDRGVGVGPGSSPTGGLADLTVFGAVKRDLQEIAKRSPELAGSGLAMTALALGREMDDDNSATSKSMCAKALLDLMDRLRELSPPDQKRDGLDDLAARRAKRLAGGAAAAH